MALAGLLAFTPTMNAQTIDLLDGTGLFTTAYNDSPNNEGPGQLIDNDPASKYLTFHSQTWVMFEATNSTTVSGYSMTSASDAPERDPLNWALEGSNNGSTWSMIDQRTNEDFATRGLKRSFTVTNTTSYRFFRLSMTNNSGTVFQLAELELLVPTPPANSALTAAFTSNKTFIAQGETVNFTNNSAGATSYFWEFPGGTPATSTAQNPTVVYNTPGTYAVKLLSTNAIGSKMMYANNHISVDKACSWGSSFVTPSIAFTDFDGGVTAGSRIFNQLIPNPTTYMQQKCLEVAKTLYRNSADAPRFRQLTFELKNDPNFVAYKWGDGSSIGIAVSTVHLTNIYNASGQNSQVIKDEIDGILFHEVTHGYNFSPITGGTYDGSSPFWAYTEGIADGVRIYNGFHQTRTPDITSQAKWLGGYTTTAFFLHYVTQFKDKNFIFKFNKAAKDLELFWSFENAFQLILGESVNSVWNQYVTYISAGNRLDYDGLYSWTLDCGLTTLGQETEFKKKPQIVPNPATNQILIKDIDNSTYQHFSLFNPMGQLVSSGKIPASNELECSNLAPGIYFLRLGSEENPNLFISKFVKE